MLYEYDAEDRRAMEGRPEMSETRFDAWWDSLPVVEKVVPLHGNSEGIAERTWNAARESAAATVESAGCVCRPLAIAGDFRGLPGLLHGRDHDSRCPIALAAAIRKSR